jgi:hypothetical protein
MYRSKEIKTLEQDFQEFGITLNENMKLTSDYKKRLLKYIQKDSKQPEGSGFLSALVNLVDTVIDGGLPRSGSQREREKAYIEFLLSHNQIGD